MWGADRAMRKELAKPRRPCRGPSTPSRKRRGSPVGMTDKRVSLVVMGKRIGRHRQERVCHKEGRAGMGGWSGRRKRRGRRGRAGQLLGGGRRSGGLVGTAEGGGPIGRHR